MNPTYRTAAPSRGFSLVEVLVAVGVLAIGMIATFPLMTYATQRSTQARRESNAVSVGQDVLERLRGELRYNSGGTATFDMQTAGPSSVDTRYRSDFIAGGVGAEHPALPTGRRAPTCTSSTGVDANTMVLDREGELYTACYEVSNPTGSTCPGPGCRLEGNIKVMWFSPNGNALERRVTGALQGN